RALALSRVFGLADVRLVRNMGKFTRQPQLCQLVDIAVSKPVATPQIQRHSRTCSHPARCILSGRPLGGLLQPLTRCGGCQLGIQTTSPEPGPWIPSKKAN